MLFAFRRELEVDKFAAIRVGLHINLMIRPAHKHHLLNFSAHRITVHDEFVTTIEADQ